MVDLGRIWVIFVTFCHRQLILHRLNEKVLKGASGPWAVVWRPMTKNYLAKFFMFM